MNRNDLYRALGAALLLAAVGVTPAAADSAAAVFTLSNGTDHVIDQFYASPPDVNDWEEDILGVDVLEPGQSVDITIDDAREDCNYDFRAVFQDGTVLEHDAVHICGGESYEYR